jgi:pantothenate kinase
MARTTARLCFGDLVARAADLAGSGQRRLLGICGAPGAGKSTLSTRLVRALGDRAVLVAMDGFHLAQPELARLGRTERKGAPDTFDASGYVDLLARLRRNGPGVPDAETVYAPEFRREIEEPVACAVAVPPPVPLVVTEGNYLLLREEPWRRIRPLLDEVWFLEPAQQVRLDRLIARHRRYGWPADQANARALGPDQANANLTALTRDLADVVLSGYEEA